MYWAPWDLVEIADRQKTPWDIADSKFQKPIIQCEFAHAWGNSCASLEKFFALYYDEKYPSIQGGFIWEWADAQLQVCDDMRKRYENVTIFPPPAARRRGKSGAFRRSKRNSQNCNTTNGPPIARQGGGENKVKDGQDHHQHAGREVKQQINQLEPLLGRGTTINAAAATSSVDVQHAVISRKNSNDNVERCFYGGDFGSTSGWEDNSFVADGLLHANRINAHPTYYEARSLQRPVFFRFSSKMHEGSCSSSKFSVSTVAVQNRFDFSTLKSVDFFVEMRDSILSPNGDHELATAQTVLLPVSLEDPDVQPKQWTSIILPDRDTLARLATAKSSGKQLLGPPETSSTKVDSDPAGSTSTTSAGSAPRGLLLFERKWRPRRLFAVYNAAAERSSTLLQRLGSRLGLTREDLLLGEVFFPVFKKHADELFHCLAFRDFNLAQSRKKARTVQLNTISEGDEQEEELQSTLVDNSLGTSDTTDGNMNNPLKFDLPAPPEEEASSNTGRSTPVSTSSGLTLVENVRLHPSQEVLIEKIEYHFVRAPVENDRGGMDVELCTGGRWLAHYVFDFLAKKVTNKAHAVLSYAWLWLKVFKLLPRDKFLVERVKAVEKKEKENYRKNRVPFNPNVLLQNVEEDHDDGRTRTSRLRHSGGFRVTSVKGQPGSSGQLLSGAAVVSSTTGVKVDASYVVKLRSEVLSVDLKTTVVSKQTKTSTAPLTATASTRSQPAAPPVEIASRVLAFSCEVDLTTCVTEHLPRVGLRFKLPKRYNAYEYFAKGPYENYADRHSSCTEGFFTEDLRTKVCPYAKPQEFGGRSSVKWVRFPGVMGIKLVEDDEIVSGAGRTRNYNSSRNVDNDDGPCDVSSLCSVSHYSTEQLATTAHAHDLVPEDATWVCIDVAHMGVGGVGGKGNVWGFDPQFLLPPKRLWKFTVEVHFYC
ncbi:unnamed protein product [Amoebophrya sp. A120]|nr:unnamed protein product [Amoebophrya sp. A120]|eukprot:GSA120T00017706001.1